MRLLLTIFILYHCTFPASAQEFQEPRKTATYNGSKQWDKITVSYGVPEVKGRKIGSMIPYGQVWRTGAREATTIHFSSLVSIRERIIEPGEYALLTIPNEREWTIILSKNSTQWGAYSYDTKDDVLRIQATAQSTKSFVETFRIGFEPGINDSVEIFIEWEDTNVSIPIQFQPPLSQTADIVKCKFPWDPIPKPSTKAELDRKIFSKCITFADVDEIISTALKQAGYAEKNYYFLNDDLAVVTQIEQIRGTGESEMQPDRWSMGPAPWRDFSISGILKALSTAKVGRYRTFVFVISNNAIEFAEYKTSFDQIQTYSNGCNVLPSSIKQTRFTNDHYVNVLVYEFQQKASKLEPSQIIPASLDATIHLEKSTLLTYLK